MALLTQDGFCGLSFVRILNSTLFCCFTVQISHALTLQKTVEYIAKLQQERTQLQEEAKRLREEIEDLNATIM